MKVAINEPCHENWNSMQPNNEGAFCLSCQKNVIDFSSKSIHEIKNFFSELTTADNICGRFKTKQLEELSFDDFFKKFKTWRLPYKLAVIVVFTFGLFSCQSNSNEQLITGEPSVINQPIDSVNNVTMGAAKLETPKEITTVVPEEIHLMGEIAPEVLRKDTIKKKKPQTQNCMIKGDVSIKKDTVKIDAIKEEHPMILGKMMIKQN